MPYKKVLLAVIVSIISWSYVAHAEPIPDSWVPVYTDVTASAPTDWIEIVGGQPVRPVPDGWVPVYNDKLAPMPDNWIQIVGEQPVEPIPNGWVPLYQADLVTPSYWAYVSETVVEPVVTSDPTITVSDFDDQTISVTTTDSTIVSVPIPDGWVPVYYDTSEPIPDNWIPTSPSSQDTTLSVSDGIYDTFSIAPADITNYETFVISSYEESTTGTSDPTISVSDGTYDTFTITSYDTTVNSEPIPDSWIPVYSDKSAPLPDNWIPTKPTISDPIPDGWIPVFYDLSDPIPDNWIQIVDGQPVSG